MQLHTVYITVLLQTYFATVVLCQTENPNYVTLFQVPETCKKAETDEFHEYYDISKLRCTACPSNSTVQTTTENRKYRHRCIC